MTGQELIDAAYQHHLSIGQADVSEAVTRARILLHANRRAKLRWNARRWFWRQPAAPVTVTVDTAGKGPLPSDFASFGKEGWAKVTGKRYFMIYRPPMVVRQMLAQSTGTSSAPRYYTDSGFALAVRYMHVGPQRPAANLATQIMYDTRCPTIVDSSDEIPGFPSDYHEAVLYNDVVACLMRDEGDLRAPEVQKEANDADREFWREYQSGRQVATRGPRYGGMRWR